MKLGVGILHNKIKDKVGEFYESIQYFILELYPIDGLYIQGWYFSI